MPNRMKTTLKNISPIVRSKLCHGCGICQSVCPIAAITMIIGPESTYVPEVDENTCNSCELCLKICPGQSVDFGLLSQRFLGESPRDELLGNWNALYIGHANDQAVRYQGASGGAVTALLLYALEEGLIDGALVTRMKDSNPLIPEPFIARSKQDILAASRSKYCPTHFGSAFGQLIHQQGRFAVVGLPCHLHGIRKAERLNSKINGKIALHMGIFCAHSVSFKGTEFVLSSLGIEKARVREVAYRGAGWPGKFSVVTDDGVRYSLPYAFVFGQVFGHFVPRRCLTCRDLTAELADISFGDAWLPELATDTIGTSMLITRSARGEEFIKKAIAKGVLTLTRMSRADAIRAQKGGYSFKNRAPARICVLKLLGKEVPNYALSVQPKSLFDYVRATKFLLEWKFEWYLLKGAIRNLISKKITKVE
ncbi:MAG: Coenzyme F420 hydrogenase/dehydrogenase, beta subunit C-terminal domain [Chloroflexi bacterium]|nr:Coenzyme F420 hydrogenase/dehydrogenase, beta subunit C-terminal domain [Chloroflexota bacterium]